MRKGIIIAGVIAGVAALILFFSPSQPEETKEAYLTKEPQKVQRYVFPPMEIKANVTVLDFTDEEPMEIVGDLDNPTPEVEE